MIRLAISMREEVNVSRGETRDCIDRRLPKLLMNLGYTPILLPSIGNKVTTLMRNLDPSGLILSGGQSPEFFGEEPCIRDLTERLLIDWFEGCGRPILGICRGMQMLTSDLRSRWVYNSEHAGVYHEVSGSLAGTVPSHHAWCLTDLPNGYEILATAYDGTIEAFRNTGRKHVGLMWHPERMEQLRDCDRNLIYSTFGGGSLE